MKSESRFKNKVAVSLDCGLGHNPEYAERAHGTIE
jgi:hypothetical protein